MLQRIEHCFEPVFDQRSRILILGTMPSPASRQQGFYYSHPRNRFWPVVAAVLGEATPISPEEKRAFALRHRLALWDVLAACDIKGASDASISAPVVNDLTRVTGSADIAAVFTTGSKASQLYRKYRADGLSLPHIALPSTSPANAKMTTGQLTESYSVLLSWLD